ncbi:hypothetical protein H072_240 [Dactylellina haptotyla CBS 200.50]|uniref:Uncharacterized protein n=1 Tax=Dactylellina haptotyla (strain CBS 200.50) TaxID=1284197 RepID=S8CDX4_DACHA|nr:hypothetical protein H072_240 [Dactylellina haptotyla CBS 200.50]
MTDILRKGLGTLGQLTSLAVGIVHSVVDTFTGSSSHDGPAVAAHNPQAMHSPGAHDYDLTGDYNSNETHHSLHASSAVMLAGPDRVLFLLTVFVGVWMVLHAIPGVHAGVLKRQETSSEESDGSFTYYQINGNGQTESPIILANPLGSTTSGVTTGSNYTTIFPSSHDGTVHNHVSVITEPETTEFITDLVVETDVVTVTLSDLEPSVTTTVDGGTVTSFQTTVVTHTGTWLHTHLSNEEAHMASWTHSHVVTAPPAEGSGGGDGEGGNGSEDSDADGHWPGDLDGQWDGDGDGHGPPGGPGTGHGNNPSDDDGDGHWPGDPDGQWDDDGDGHGPPGGPGSESHDGDWDGHWPGDPDGQWDLDGDGHGPPGGPGTGNGNNPNDGDGDGHWPNDPDGHWDLDGDGHGPPGTRPPCPFDTDNHSSAIDDQAHHSSGTLTWAHDITLTYVTTNTLAFDGTTYLDTEIKTLTEEEEVIVTTKTNTLVDDGTTYLNAETLTSTEFGEIIVTTETQTIVDDGTTYTEVATVTTTDLHFDPVTTIDATEWTEHTATHPHNSGPTEYIPSHTHHHTFTLLTTFTTTITTNSATLTYMEWVSATTVTL